MKAWCRWTLGVAIVCAFLPAGEAHAFDRDTIILYSELYTKAPWMIDLIYEDEALHDKPDWRYQEAYNDCNWRYTWPTINCSPFVAYFGAHGPVNQQMHGFPYSYGRKMEPIDAVDWVADGCQKAIGQEYDQWKCRSGRYMDKWPYAFAGCVDCSGFACYVTDFWGHNPEGMECNTTCLYNEPHEGQDSYFVYRCNAQTGRCDNQWGQYESMEKGDIFVKEEWHVAVFKREENGRLFFTEATGAPDWERCAEERDWPDTYYNYLAFNWRGLSVRSLYNNPATSFWATRAVRDGAEVVVSWTCLYLKNTWGFVVEASADGEGDWVEVSDYIEVANGTQDEPVSFEWSGEVGLDWIRVLEIEEGSQKLTESGTVKVVTTP